MLIAAVVMLAQIAVAPNTVLIAVLRTLTGCVLALVLAYVGSRTLRIELVWIAYATMGFIALKLLFEDLQAGSAGAIALSIFLYAITLILVPRLVRIGEKISLSC
jgi:membrane-bound ClpP family serine protease